MLVCLRHIALILLLPYLEGSVPEAHVLSAESSLKERDEIKTACFPSPHLAISLPSRLVPNPSSKASGQWWCGHDVEFAWLGYSYHVGDCPTRTNMIQTFKWMKAKKMARYVRLYGGCDDPSFDNDVIEAAAQIGMGIYALIWFGFNRDDNWKGRKSRLLNAIQSNPKAPYIIRAVTVGSEPLYDQVLPIGQFVEQINDVKAQLTPYGIPVTVSELPQGFKNFQNATDVFNAVDFVCLNVLPFFEGNATVGSAAFSWIIDSVSYAQFHGKGKRISITQTGWPSNQNSWRAGSKAAVASVDEESDYFKLLDSQCPYFKSQKVGWFSHVYNETTVDGWGLVYGNGSEKFPFHPQIVC